MLPTQTQTEHLHSPRPYRYYSFIYFVSAILFHFINELPNLSPDSNIYFLQIMMSLLFSSLYVFLPVTCGSILVYILEFRKTMVTFILNIILNVCLFAITASLLTSNLPHQPLTELPISVLDFMTIGVFSSSLAWLSLPKLKSKI